MSGKVVGWAFGEGREKELSPTQRLVLIAYGDNANEKDGKCWPDKDEIVEKTGLSQATVYRAIKELEAADLLVFTTDPRGRPCAYLTVPWFSHGEKDDSQSEKKDSHSEKSTNKGTVKEPSQRKRPKKKVGQKVVADDEFDLAAAVVSQFNSSAGTELTTEAHLTPIVGRIRERPKLTAEQHGKIIEAVFAGERWWKGPATPKIIYGNPAIFEQSIELARERRKQTEGRDEDPNAERERVQREFREANDVD